MEENEYVIHDLDADDLFLMVNVLNKIGVDKVSECVTVVRENEAFKDALKDGGKMEEALSERIGMLIMIEIAKLVVGRLPECKAEIYAMLAHATRQSEKDFGKIKMIPLVKLIKAFFKRQEFPDFFTEVFGLLD